MNKWLAVVVLVVIGQPAYACLGHTRQCRVMQIYTHTRTSIRPMPNASCSPRQLVA